MTEPVICVDELSVIDWPFTTITPSPMLAIVPVMAVVTIIGLVTAGVAAGSLCGIRSIVGATMGGRSGILLASMGAPVAAFSAAINAKSALKKPST